MARLDEVEATKTMLGRTERCFDLKPKRQADGRTGSKSATTQHHARVAEVAEGRITELGNMIDC